VFRQVYDVPVSKKYKKKGVLISRIKSIVYPYYISWFISFIGLHLSSDLKTTLSNLSNSIFELVFIDMAGFRVGYYSNSVTWYLSALFLNIIFFLPFMEYFGKSYLKKIAPVVSIFLYGILALNSSFLFGPHTIMFGCIYKGMIRCAAGVNAGLFIYSLYENKGFVEFLKRKIKLTYFVSIFSFILIMTYLIIPSPLENVNDYTYIILLFFFLVPVFCITSILENKISKIPFISRIGKFSIYVYFSQGVVYSQKDRLYDWNISNYYKIFIFICFCFISAILVYGIELLCRKLFETKKDFFAIGRRIN